MGWARLHFDNTGSINIGHVMRDIVGVVSGSITDTSTLLYATPNLSEITNSAGRGNWTRTYPSALTTSTPQVLVSTCTNSALKVVQLTSMGSGDLINNTTWNDTYQWLANAARQGIVLRSATSATAATTLTSPSFVNSATNLNTGNYITGPYIWVSWSARHLMLIGNSRGSSGTANDYVGATGCFEFNELSNYDNRNVAPFCHAQWFDTFVATDFTSAAAPTNSTARNQSSFFIMNHYNPSTTSSTGALNLLSTVTNQQYMPVTATNSGFYPTVFTKNSSGANAAYLQPLFFHQHHIGVPHMYISDLCKVYRTQSGIGLSGDTMTVGGDTYVYYDLFSSNTGSFALAVLKA